MQIVKAPRVCKFSKMLIAKLAPSTGSVPEPSSSNKIKLDEVASFKICVMRMYSKILEYSAHRQYLQKSYQIRIHCCFLLQE